MVGKMQECLTIPFRVELKQVWHWSYEAPGIVGSGLYDITIVCGPKDMSLEKCIPISQKNIKTMAISIYSRWISIFIIMLLSKSSFFNLHNSPIM